MGKKEGYKKTAVGWIPEDWDVHKFGNLFEERKEINNIELPLLAVTNSDGIVLRDTLTKKDTSASDKSKYKTVYPYDIAYNTMRLWQGVSGLSAYKGIVSPAYTVLKPKEKVYSPFYQYLMKTERMINWFYRFSSGICSDTNNCKYQAFRKIPAVLPPLPEQKKIADILTTVDDKISSIDSQIQQTEQLKKGLMEKLLTEGIEHTEFKETEIGRIPVGWDVKTIDSINEIVDYRGKTPQKSNSGIFLITARNIKGGRINYSVSQEFIPKENYEEVMRRGKPQIGDVLITTEAPMGEVAVIDDEKVALAQRIIKLRGKQGILFNGFLKYYLASHYFQKRLDLESTGSTVKGIKGSRLKNMLLIVPPLPEQKQIATILSTVDDKLDILTQKKSQYQTLKKGLSQQLLTGRMRVKV
jgi:type I restriction enzyme, S subunit